MVQFYSFFNLGVKWGLMFNATPWPLYPREGDPLPIIQKAGCAPGWVGTGTENLARIGFRTPNRPICSQTLYQIRQPGHLSHFLLFFKILKQKFCIDFSFLPSTPNQIFSKYEIKYAPLEETGVHYRPTGSTHFQRVGLYVINVCMTSATIKSNCIVDPLVVATVNDLTRSSVTPHHRPHQSRLKNKTMD